MGLPRLRALEYLPEEEHGEEHGNIDVRDKEVAYFESEEDGVAIDEDECQAPEDTPNGEVWLQVAVVCGLATVDVLSLLSSICNREGDTLMK